MLNIKSKSRRSAKSCSSGIRIGTINHQLIGLRGGGTEWVLVKDPFTGEQKNMRRKEAIGLLEDSLRRLQK
jgi:hypothetical protein